MRVTSKAIDWSKYIKNESDHKKHALYSPSGLDRVFECPGSVKLIAKSPKGRITAASLKGVNAHTLLEFLLREGKTGEEVFKSVDALPFRKHIGWTSEMNEAVRSAREFVIREYKNLWAKYGIKPTLLVERKVYLDDAVKAECNGTSDTIMFVPKKELHVMDYKNGTYKVNPQNNTQMMAYALGFMHEFGLDHFPIIKMSIIQPNAFGKHTPGITWQTTPRVMKDFQASLIVAINKSKQKDAPVIVNRKHCFFCPANEARLCPAQKDLKRDKLRSKF